MPYTVRKFDNVPSIQDKNKQMFIIKREEKKRCIEYKSRELCFDGRILCQWLLSSFFFISMFIYDVFMTFQEFEKDVRNIWTKLVFSLNVALAHSHDFKDSMFLSLSLIIVPKHFNHQTLLKVIYFLSNV